MEKWKVIREGAKHVHITYLEGKFKKCDGCDMLYERIDEERR